MPLGQSANGQPHAAMPGPAPLLLFRLSADRVLPQPRKLAACPVPKIRTRTIRKIFNKIVTCGET